MIKRSSLTVLIVLTAALLALGGCTVIRTIGGALGSSTIVLYTPITYCQGVYAATGEPVAISVYVYRINSIVNNQRVPVTLDRGHFYVSIPDSHLPTITSRTLETFPSALTVGPGETVTLPGALALRADTAARSAVVLGDANDPATHVHFRPLIYDPTLRGNPSGVISINERGVWSRATDLRPCSVREVMALIDSTP